MKRILLPLLLMMFAAIGVQAQTKMILHQKTGGDIEIAFSDNPVATFEGNYWYSSLYSNNACSLGFDSSGVGRYGSYRNNGQSVRPVCP